jgi:hypothetical protein
MGSSELEPQLRNDLKKETIKVSKIFFLIYPKETRFLFNRLESCIQLERF